MDRILPPPPSVSKSRNESMNSALPTYRNRPGAQGTTTSHFANAKSLFESLNRPAIRNGISQVAKNPLAQRAAVAIARNDAARTAVVNAAQTASTGREPDPMVTQMAHGSIMSMVKQFENKPIMGFGTTSSKPDAGGDRVSPSSFSFDQKAEPSYNSLTAIDPFEYPPQLPSAADFNNRSKSSEPFGYGAFSYDKKPPPSRPPPPKNPNSWSNPNISSPLDSLTNEAHGVAKYPYRASQVDELNCDPGDTLLLDNEVDDQWVHATNTRTGASGILPVNFIDVKIPLASQPSTTARFSAAPAASTGSWGNKQVMTAVYDFQSDVEGDLNFKAGELVVVHEMINAEWYNGELHGKFGIFPSNYVQPIGGSGNTKSKIVTALFDYKSGVAEDLQFVAGDQIEVVDEIGADWISGRLNGKAGLVPLTYVQRN